MGPYDVQIGEAEIQDPWEISIGDASLFPEQEAGALELPASWQILLGDAQLDPSVTVDIGTPDVMGPNEFMLDDGTKESWDFGPIEIRDTWK